MPSCRQPQTAAQRAIAPTVDASGLAGTRRDPKHPRPCAIGSGGVTQHARALTASGFPKDSKTETTGGGGGTLDPSARSAFDLTQHADGNALPGGVDGTARLLARACLYVQGASGTGGAMPTLPATQAMSGLNCCQSRSLVVSAYGDHVLPPHLST